MRCLADVPRTLAEPGQPSLQSFTSSDGCGWLYRRYAPPGAPLARLVFLHGIQSHGGWYVRSSARLAAAGYEVFFLERRGCGLNEERRGDVPSFRRALDDIVEFIRALPRDGTAVFLAAISWGGKLGAALPYRHPGIVDGIALLCPGLVAKVTPPFLSRWTIALARVFRPRKLFPIPLNDPKLFTSSIEWQRFVDSDGLSLRQATARMLFNSYALGIYLRRARKRLTAPVLLLLAEHDAIVDNEATRAYVEGAPALDKQIMVYAGAHHTLEFEAADHAWLDDLIAWIEKRRNEESRPRHSSPPLSKGGLGG
jgi:alpha-beta hydrolase superfamily lysophospholipase